MGREGIYAYSPRIPVSVTHFGFYKEGLQFPSKDKGGTNCDSTKVLKTFPNSTKFLKTLVSFGSVKPEQKEVVGKHGLAIYSWDEFLALGNDQQFDLPVREKTDIYTFMYTSGTTGDPKRVMISNRSIVCLISGIAPVVEYVNEQCLNN